MPKKPINIEDVKITKLLQSLSPDLQHLSKAIVQMRVENKALKNRIDSLIPEHKQLYKILCAILFHEPERKLEIHSTQFLNFDESWRIDRRFDEKTGLMSLKLLTITDEIPDPKKD